MQAKRILAMVVVAALGLSFHARAADLTWNTGDGTWDTDTGNTPWNPGPDYFEAGDSVTFDDTGAGGTISIPANVAPASTTVTGTANYTFSGAGGITSGSLTKSGARILTLGNAANSFSGITLAGGTISTAAANRLGSTGAGTTISVNGDAALSVTASGVNIGLPMGIAAGVTATLTSSAWGSWYSGPITGDGSLRIVPGGGTWWFINNASSTFAGDIYVEAGTSFTGDSSMGASTKTIYWSGGNLSLNGTFDANRTLDIEGGGTFEGTGVWNGLVSGTYAGPLRLDGRLTLTNPGNSFTASYFYVNTGELAISDPGCVNHMRIEFRNGALSSLKIIGTPTVSFDNDLRIGGYPIIIEEADAVVNWTGPMVGVGLKRGPGTLAVYNYDNNSGGFTVEEGTLLVNDTATTGLRSHTVQDGATLAGTGQIGLGGGYGVSVESGGTLGGTVTVTGGTGVTVADGGIVAPGESAGTLTLGSLVLNNGSILNFELDGPNVEGGDNDFIRVNGALTLDGILNVTFTDTPVILQPYRLFGYTGALANNTLEVGTGLPKRGIIDWSVGGQVNLILIPEPATAMLLGLAGLLPLWRRR